MFRYAPAYRSSGKQWLSRWCKSWVDKSSQKGFDFRYFHSVAVGAPHLKEVLLRQTCNQRKRVKTSFPLACDVEDMNFLGGIFAAPPTGSDEFRLDRVLRVS